MKESEPAPPAGRGPVRNPTGVEPERAVVGPRRLEHVYPNEVSRSSSRGRSSRRSRAADYNGAVSSSAPRAAAAPSGSVLGLRVDRVDYDEAVRRIVLAAERGAHLRVAAANVHVVMEARRDPELGALLARYDLVVPDGQPLRWALDATGAVRLPDRVYGPELMRRTCIEAAARGIPVYLFGATEAVIAALLDRLPRVVAPDLAIAGAHAPPFGEALWRQAERDADRIRQSGARVAFVGLGCPKQERWIGLWAERAGAACIGVGAAFDLWAGAKPMAPRWMQRAGLEWLFRLATEPRRTFRRYAVHNPRFAVLATAEIVAARRARRAGRAGERSA